MPIHNSDISRKLRETADLLEIEGANEFRVRAYRNAAQTVDNLSEEIDAWREEHGDLTELPGVGDSIADKIDEILETGSLDQLQEKRQEMPETVTELLEVEGLGPEKVSDLYEKLEITSLEELKEAIEHQKVRELEGFGQKTEEKLARNIERALRESRTLLIDAEEYTEPLINYMQQLESIDRIAIAGSYRRRKETVGDIDILVTCSDAESVMEHLTAYDDVEEVKAQGGTKSTVRLKNDLQVDLRVVDDLSYGAALVYFTGSKDHNIALRDRALDRGLKINEYGVFEEGNEREPIAGATEKEVYESVSLPVIPPELRENRGELKAAESHTLPELITRQDLTGDIHMHTTATDGNQSIREMAEAAASLGYEYIAITDHSQRVTVAGGLNEEELREHMEEITQTNEAFSEIEILTGIEVDILEDGSLDLKSDVLSELDLVIGSIHYKFGLSREEQTQRYLKAIDHPELNVIGHPTGRILNGRDAFDMDLDAVFEAAVEAGVHFEINASPKRLDLNDANIKRAKDHGAQFTIATDAHSAGELSKIGFGVNQARRGWLEASDVINTRSLSKFKSLLER